MLSFQVSFSLAFFGALRVGELVPPSKHSKGGLGASDVVLVKDAVRICIWWSKTDVFGQGEWLLLRRVEGTICPGKLVEDYSAVRPHSEFFLTYLNVLPLTRFKFSVTLRRCLTAVGLNANDFGTHSFRIGAATEAARAGLPETEIQRIGRWRSSCYSGYICLELLI